MRFELKIVATAETLQRFDLENLAGRRGWRQAKTTPRIESRGLVPARVRVIGQSE